MQQYYLLLFVTCTHCFLVRSKMFVITCLIMFFSNVKELNVDFGKDVILECDKFHNAYCINMLLICIMYYYDFCDDLKSNIYIYDFKRTDYIKSI